jgi:hypothetical protein
VACKKGETYLRSSSKGKMLQDAFTRDEKEVTDTVIVTVVQRYQPPTVPTLTERSRIRM